MLTLEDIERVLREYGNRFDFLDVFVDDVQGVQDAAEGHASQLTHTIDRTFVARVNGSFLSADIFPTGVARFRRIEEAAPTARPENKAAALALLGAALGAAIDAKRGLLGGLVLGLLLGSAGQDQRRVMTLRFDHATRGWRLYEGPLQSWAKRRLAAA